MKHILGESTDVTSSSDPAPPTSEWLKIDSIILSWIFMTLSKTLQSRLVVENPRTAKEAWDILAEIFNDNKRSRSIALKAELRSLKLGDLSTDAYFHKIESIATILASLVFVALLIRSQKQTHFSIMTVTSAPPAILLSDKLMTITNLNIIVPIKLNVDEMNYASWTYFMKHILGESTDVTSSSDPAPPTSECHDAEVGLFL
nr:hybrid signal transduction histidine kinase M [Tanacetum cinerariifolium]